MDMRVSLNAAINLPEALCTGYRAANVRNKLYTSFNCIKNKIEKKRKKEKKKKERKKKKKKDRHMDRRYGPQWTHSSIYNVAYTRVPSLLETGSLNKATGATGAPDQVVESGGTYSHWTRSPQKQIGSVDQHDCFCLFVFCPVSLPPPQLNTHAP